VIEREVVKGREEVLKKMMMMMMMTILMMMMMMTSYNSNEVGQMQAALYC